MISLHLTRRFFRQHPEVDMVYEVGVREGGSDDADVLGKYSGATMMGGI